MGGKVPSTVEVNRLQLLAVGNDTGIGVGTGLALVGVSPDGTVVGNDGTSAGVGAGDGESVGAMDGDSVLGTMDDGESVVAGD